MVDTIKPTGVTLRVVSITPDEDGRDVDGRIAVDGVAEGSFHLEAKAAAGRLEVGATYELKRVQ